MIKVNYLEYIPEMIYAQMIIKVLDKYITDMDEVIGLGFCVLRNMLNIWPVFNHNNIPSIYLTAESDDETRNEAKEDLLEGIIALSLLLIYIMKVSISQK